MALDLKRDVEFHPLIRQQEGAVISSDQGIFAHVCVLFCSCNFPPSSRGMLLSWCATLSVLVNDVVPRRRLLFKLLKVIPLIL